MKELASFPKKVLKVIRETTASSGKVIRKKKTVGSGIQHLTYRQTPAFRPEILQFGGPAVLPSAAAADIVDAPLHEVSLIPPTPEAVSAATVAVNSRKRREEAKALYWQQVREQRERNEQQRQVDKWKDHPIKELNKMTVSLYKSTASGSMDVVVQTNAQNLDVFITGLSDALHAALVHEASAPNSVDTSQALIAATLKNAIPVAFAIAGYKAEKVSESKLLTCGFASPDASELLAQSKV